MRQPFAHKTNQVVVVCVFAGVAGDVIVLVRSLRNHMYDTARAYRSLCFLCRRKLPIVTQYARAEA